MKVKLSISLFFYDLGLRLYFFLIRMLAWFSKKASLFVNGRKDWEISLKQKSHELKGSIWFHCASLGEFEQARPLIEKIRTEFPMQKIVLSFFSPSGFEIRKNYDRVDHVCYLPMDSKTNAKVWLQLVQPQLVVFVKYEFWFHYLQELKEQKVITVLLSAHFTTDSIFFKWYGYLHRKMLSFFDRLYVQSMEEVDLLKEIGVKHATIAGDTRTDRVIEISKEAFSDSIVEQFIGSTGRNKVIVVGSSWPKDEQILQDWLKSSASIGFKLLLVPHEIEQQRLTRFCAENVGCQLYSSWEAEISRDSKCLLIDKTGILSRLYRYGAIAYIGGGHEKGIHNILEAAVYGCALVCGPRIQRANEAKQLHKMGLLHTISSANDLIQLLSEAYTDEKLASIASKLKDFVQTSSGATAKVFDSLKPVLTKADLGLQIS